MSHGTGARLSASLTS